MRLNINILRRITPRWVVFFIDICICLISLILAYYLRFNFSIPSREVDKLPIVVITVLSFRALSFYIGKTYAGMVRHTGTKDVIRIFITLLISSASLIFANLIYLHFYDKYLIPTSIIIIDFFITTFTLSFSRLFLKNIFLEFNTATRKESNNVLIYGSSDLALITKKTVDRDSKSNYRVVGFIDHHTKMKGSKIDGVRVYHLKNLKKILDEKKVSVVIISEKGMSINRKNYVIETCLNRDVEIKTIPYVSSLISDSFSLNQLKNIRIEDLLERPEIKMDKDGIRKSLLNKTILITGAAGSIGSELVRQVIKFLPKKILLLDIAESPLYDIELEVREHFKFNDIEIIIGDIRNKNFIDSVFIEYKPDFVYHAAAYKHVPMMENHPNQAINTNIKGTKILAEASLKYKSQKFVMISTDKAVNPTNVMGASKRIAEILVQALSKNSETKFVTTRFGNVLGSNGSVIPRFRKQIETGGPVTVTDPEITRYFMTIPEACQLVLEAGNMGEGGEVFIFDMGKPVKIIHLAKKMISLSGLKPGKDIQINITGLRPGEKLYEELLANKENTLPTYHSQIMIAKLKEYDINKILPEINILIEKAETNDKFNIVKKMKEIVPEFISKNSVYEILDIN
ncbi:MAG: polysaccharide biosynthesis protein [Bacteroidales bacterium]|nr:polysaccharide biosynthesis protein [Bacteroidales bacterium]MCK9498492.1 polysaccharide biosynthesis protein [Bacteroidales bacterium]MDY0314120.1 nucleoside-diphosphate sugar epimerase/dehydratase [Bacteroidales bacterium]NLB87100.1 polysaccharide biosynthesis protein [Bacteroidales bacterium]